MTSIKHSRAHRRAFGLVAMSAAAALLLAGCSAVNTTDSGTSAPAGEVPQEVLDQITEYSASRPLDFAGAPFDASSAAGKTVWRVPSTSQNPFLATVGAAFEEALASAGVTLIECDGNSNPVDANNCIEQAVAQGADAIEIDGPEPSTVSNSISSAVAADIPIIIGAGIDAADPIPAEITGITSQPYTLSGELAADWIIEDSQAAANVLLIVTPDVVGSIKQQKGFEAQMEKYCANCTVTVASVTLGNWATDLGQTTSGALSRDPSINYVFPVFDPMTQFTNPAIQQAGRAADVKVVTVNGNLPFMQDLASPDSLTNAMVGLDLDALGWLQADQVLRALTGNDAVPLVYPPARLFTKQSVGEITLTPDDANDGSWYGGSGTTAEFFEQLWKG